MQMTQVTSADSQGLGPNIQLYISYHTLCVIGLNELGLVQTLQEVAISRIHQVIAILYRCSLQQHVTTVSPHVKHGTEAVGA